MRTRAWVIAGLYYYYQTFAKAIAMGKAEVVDSLGQGLTTGGPTLLGARKAARGRTAGWVNPADRFMEGDPNVVTAYAVIALSHARAKA